MVSFSKKVRYFLQFTYLCLMRRLIITSLLSFFIFACGNDLDDLDALEIPSPVPNSVYYNYEIFYSDSGLTQVKMAGRVLEQHAASQESGGRDHMKDSVHLWFYDNDMKVQSEMIADSAIRGRETGYMEAFGNVIVYNEKGEQLKTEHLIWDEKRGKIISNTKVAIIKKTQIIYGDGLISDQNFLDYEIKNPHGKLIIDNESE